MTFLIGGVAKTVTIDQSGAFGQTLFQLGILLVLRIKFTNAILLSAIDLTVYCLYVRGVGTRWSVLCGAVGGVGSGPSGGSVAMGSWRGSSLCLVFCNVQTQTLAAYMRVGSFNGEEVCFLGGEIGACVWERLRWWSCLPFGALTPLSLSACDLSIKT